MDEHVEELEDLVEQPADAAAPLATPSAPPQAHKQLYQFLWGGITVLFGCLLPLHRQAIGWQADSFDAALRGPTALFTVGGSITAFVALIFVATQISCIRNRRIMISPLFLMAGVAWWAWANVVNGFGASSAFGDGGAPWHHVFYKANYFTDLWQHVGPSLLFVLLGSTFVWVVFLHALFAPSGKKDEAKEKKARGGGAAAGRRGRGRR